MNDSPLSFSRDIAPMKGLYFNPGSASSVDSYLRQFGPAIEERNKSRQEREARKKLKEQQAKEAAEAAAEAAVQERLEETADAVSKILKEEDPQKQEKGLEDIKSNTSILDLTNPRFKSVLSLGEEAVNKAKDEIEAQKLAQESTLEASANLLVAKGKLKQARAVAKEITDPAKRDEILSTIAGKKPNTAEGRKQQFIDITKRADSALSALSKIETSSVAQEPEDEGEKTGDTPGVEVTKREATQGEATQGEATQGEGTQGEGTQGEGTQGEGTQGENILDFDRVADSGTSTSKANRQILQAARDSYAEMFGAKKADELFGEYDADNISASERRELVDKFSKKLKGIKSRSISNKKFLEQFVPGKRFAPGKGKTPGGNTGTELDSIQSTKEV